MNLDLKQIDTFIFTVHDIPLLYSLDSKQNVLYYCSCYSYHDADCGQFFFDVACCQAKKYLVRNVVGFVKRNSECQDK